MNETGSLVFQELERSGDLELALTFVTKEFPSVPVSEIRSDVDRLIENLLRRGLLVPGPDHAWQAGGTPVALTAPAASAIPLPRRLFASVCLVAAVLLLRLPFRTVVKAVSALKHRMAGRAASQADGEASVSIVHSVSDHIPLRIACMEVSLAAVLLCAARGRALDWCFGHAADPVGFHSWVEADGQPVRDPREEPITAVYQRIFAI